MKKLINKINIKINELKNESWICKLTILTITAITITFSIQVGLTLSKTVTNSIQVTTTQTETNEVTIRIQPIICIGPNACDIH